MAEQQQDPTNPGVMKLANYMQRTYYPNKSPKEIYDFAIANPQSFEKGLKQLHKDRFGQIEYSRFRDDYFARYGNPFAQPETKDATVTYPQELPSVAIETAKAAEQFDWAEVQKQIKALNIDPYSTEQVVPVIPGVQQTLTKDFLGDSSISMIEEKRQGDFTTTADQWAQRDITQYDKLRQRRRSPMESMYADAGFMSDDQSTLAQYQAEMQALANENAALDEALTKIEKDLNTSWAKKIGAEPEDFKGVFGWIKEQNNKLKPLISQIEQLQGQDLNNPDIRDRYNKIVEEYNAVLEPMKALEADPMYQKYQQYAQLHENNYQAAKEKLKQDNYRSVRELLDMQENIEQYDEQIAQQKGKLKKIDHFADHIILNSVAKAVADLGAWMNTLETNILGDEEYTTWDKIEDWTKDLAADAERVYPTPTKYSRPIFTQTSKWNGYEVDFRGEEIEAIRKPDGTAMIAQLSEQQKEEIRKLPRERQFNNEGLAWQVGAVTTDLLWQIAGTKGARTGLLKAGVKDKFATQAAVMGATAATLGYELEKEGLEIFDGDREKAAQYVATTAPLIGLVANFAGLEGKLAGGSGSFLDNLMKGSTPAMRARMAAGRFTVRDMAALRTTELLKAVGGEAFEEAILEKVVETGTRYMLGGGVDLPIIEDVMNEAVLAGAAALVMGGGQFSISKSDLYRSSFLEGVKNPGAFSEALGKSLRQGVIPFDVPAGMDREAQIEAAVQAQRGRLERVASQLQDINSQLDDKVDQSAVAVLLDARNQITDVINKARKDKNLPLEEKAQKKADEIDARLRTLLETGKLPESIAPTVPAYEAVTFVEEEVVETAQPGPGTPDVPAPVVEWDIEPTPEPVTDETPRVVEMKPTKPATRLRDAEGKRVNYRNIVGRLRQDPEDGTYYVETPQGQQYEVAGGGAADTPVSEIEGIKEVFPEPNVDYESDESIMITGREGDYSWVGENLTEDGAVRSVELRRNSDGKKLVITDPALAESISFARNMAREDVPDFNSADLAQNEAVDLNEKEVSRLAAELDNAPEVVDGFLEHNAAPLVQGGSPDAIARNSEGQFTDDELAEVSLWAEDTINMIDREYPESTYAANLKNRLSNVKAAADSLLEGETRPATEQPAVEQPTQDVQAEPEQPDAEPDAEPEPEFDAEPEPEQPDVSTEPVAAPPSNEARDVIDAYEQAPLSKKEVADVLYNNNLLEGDFATIEAALDKVPNDTVQDALERFRALKIHPKHRPAGLTQDQQNAYDAQLDRYARDLVQQLYRWAGIDPIDMRRAELGPSFSQRQYDSRVDYAANIALQAGLPDIANNLLSMQSYPPPRGFDIEAKIEGLKKRLLAKQAREFNLPETAPNLPKKRLSSWKNKVLKKKIRGKVLDPKKLNKEVSTIVEHTYNRLYAGDSKVLQTGNEPADPLGKMVDRNDGGGPLSQYDGASALLVAAMKNYVETWYKKNILKYPSIKQSDVDEALEELAYAEAEFDSVLLILDTRVEQATGAMTEAVVTEHNDPKKAVTDFLRSPLLSSRPEIHELIKQFITEGATDTQLRDTLLLAFAFSSAKLTPDGWVIRVSKHGKVPKVFALNPSKPAQRTNLIGSGLVDAFRAAHGIPKKKRAPVERETLGDKVAQMRLESATDEVYAALAEGVRIFTDDFYNWGDPNAVKDNRAIAARFLGKKNARRIDDWAQELADKWGIPFKGDGTQQGAIEIIIDAIIDGKISEYIDMRLEDQQNPAQQEEAEGLTMEEKEELPEGEVEQATQLADSIFDNLTDEEVSEFESALMPYMDEFGNVDWNAFAEDYNSEEIMDFLGWSQNLKDGVKRAIEQGAEPEEQAEDEVPADDLEIEGEGTEQEGETELEEDLPPWLLDEEPEEEAPIQQPGITDSESKLNTALKKADSEIWPSEEEINLILDNWDNIRQGFTTVWMRLQSEKNKKDRAAGIMPDIDRRNLKTAVDKANKNKELSRPGRDVILRYWDQVSPGTTPVWQSLFDEKQRDTEQSRGIRQAVRDEIKAGKEAEERRVAYEKMNDFAEKQGIIAWLATDFNNKDSEKIVDSYYRGRVSLEDVEKLIKQAQQLLPGFWDERWVSDLRERLGAVKSVQPKTLEVKALEQQLEAAIKELAAAEDAMKKKSRELDKNLADDTPDLFGERKTKGGLFDMRADGSRKSEVMQSYRVRVQKAKETVKRLSSELEQAKSRGEQTLFDQQQMVDDLESGKIKEVKNGIGLNLLSPKAEEILMRKIRLQWKRTFTSHGDLPKVIADLNRDRMARITAWMRSVKIAADSLTANAKKAYGAPRFRLFGIEIGRRNPPKWVMEDINGALQNPTLHSVHPRLRTGHPIDPAVVRDLRTMRGQIDLMSQAMVSMGLATGDLAVTITANQGVYLTRSYRVHDDAEWLATIRNQPDWERIKRWYVNLQRKRALDMQKAIRAERAKVAAKQLQLSAGGLTVKQAIRLQKSIDHSNNIIIPRLQRNYNEALHASRNPDARLEAMIKDQQESFAFTGSAKKGKLGHKDLGILKARKNIPTEIRQLFGEYFDPRINYGKSIYRQIHLIANENFLREVKAQGIGTFLFEKPTTVGGVNYSVKIAAEGSKTMAPLNGLYTTPEIADALALYNVPISYGKGLLGDLNRWMSMGSLLVKSAKTIFSPVTHTRNFNSAPGFLLMSGNVFSAWYRDGTITEKMYNVGKQLLSDVALPWLFVPQMLLTNFGKGGLNIFNVSSKAGRAWDLAFKTNVWAKGDTSLEQELRYLIGNGLFDEEVTYSEMRDMINAQHQEQDSVFFNSLLSYDSLTNELRRLTETVAGMYQAEDLYHRIIAFYNERERYTHALHGMSWDDLVASGATVAADQMSRRAADNVRRTYQSYSMVPENIKAISRFPLLASFIQFTAESIRTGYQNILLIREDMADPRTKGIAMQRAAGMFFASVYGAALSEAATQVASGLLGLFDDEEDDDANTYRPFLPEWSENSAVSILSKDGPEFTYLDWGGQLVYGSTWGITGDILATTVGVGPAWNTYPDRLATEFMDVAGLDIAFENSLKAVFNMTRLTPDASPITYATGKEGVFDRAKYFLEKNQPGITYSAQRVGRALEKWGETGDKSDLIREMAVLSSGLRLTPIDIEETWQFMSRRYANSLREKRSIYRVQAARLDRQARELGKTLTPVERLNELEEYAILAMKEHQAVVEELIEVYHLAVNHGANYQVLDKLLNEAGVNKGNIEKIKRGQIFLPVLEPELKK